MPENEAFRLQCLTLSGPDAAEFAQSQFTADLDALESDRWTPAAWCDSKGRAIALVLIAPQPSSVRLAVPEPLAADLARRLTLYTIGRKVTISDPEPIAPADPASPNPAAIRLANDPDRALAPGARADDDTWRRWLAADIDRGVAWILPATSGRFLPQMLDLEAQGGLSYRKGCWPGQEVVARVRYRGRIKRAAGPFSRAGAPPEPGATIAVEGRDATVLYAVAAADGDRCSGLAVIDVPAHRDTAAGQV